MHQTISELTWTKSMRSVIGLRNLRCQETTCGRPSTPSDPWPVPWNSGCVAATPS